MQNDWSGLAEDSKSSVLCQQAAWRETVGGVRKRNEKNCFLRANFIPRTHHRHLVGPHTGWTTDRNDTKCWWGHFNLHGPETGKSKEALCYGEIASILYFSVPYINVHEIPEGCFYEMCWVSPIQLIHSHVHGNLVFPRKYCKPLPMGIRLSGKKNCSRARHEGILVRGGVAHLILNLSVR